MDLVPPPPPPPQEDGFLPPPPPVEDGFLPPPPPDDFPPPPPREYDLPPPPPPVDDDDEEDEDYYNKLKKMKATTTTFKPKPKAEIPDTLELVRNGTKSRKLQSRVRPRVILRLRPYILTHLQARFISAAEREANKKKRQADEEKARQEQKAKRYSETPTPTVDTSPSLQDTSSDSDQNNWESLSHAPQVSVGKRGIPTAPAAMRKTPAQTNRSTPHTNGIDRTTDERNGPKSLKRPAPEDADAALIKERYMGSDLNQSKFSAQKKRRRTTEKKFTFEWSLDEDTTADNNPIYQNQIEANFFGKGRLAGFDDKVAEAKAREYAKAIEARDPKTGAQRAAQLLEMEQRRKEHSLRYNIDKHWSKKSLTEMRERDWRIFKEDYNIQTKGGSLPHPMRDWSESGLAPELLDIIQNVVHYDQPTPVQRACIPIALAARDIIGVAVTGSGKTAAFILPLIMYIRKLPPITRYNAAEGPYAIVLAPTRELAQQIEDEANKFCEPLGLRCLSIVGGHAIEEQAFKLRDGASIIIATPGRLVDCLERRVLVLSQCCYVVMDEADRMVDMGFEEPVNKILSALPSSNIKPDDDSAENSKAMSVYFGDRDRYRQTMMYTATMPVAVERIARSYLRRPAQVTIGNVGEAVETVEQRVEMVQGEDARKKRLEAILHSNEFGAPIIVFVNIKRNCDAIAKDIKRMGYSAISLHGSKSQEQREEALAALRSGAVEILVATDLAGRGIDVQDVSLVVNFNMATSIEQYTHRIGRTGRAGKTGVAITFLGSEDQDLYYDLKQMLSKSKISKCPDSLSKHPAAQQRPQRGAQKQRNIEH